MHHVAEEGVASHWLYKGADLTLNDLQKRTHQWLQSLLDIQSQTGDSGEFLEHVKVDLFPDAVYVFTRAARSSRCARRHAGGLRLRDSHRHRQPGRGRQGQR